MKILVTGGAGFIGSAVIRHIIANTDDSVVNLYKLTYVGNLESLASVSDNLRYAFEQVDICDASALAAVFQRHQPDAVMHQETFKAGICKTVQCYLENSEWCQRVQDGSYRRERLGTKRIRDKLNNITNPFPCHRQIWHSVAV